ncbi:MAG: hypothetical protein JNL23_07790 [Chitinophagaceae bacterium]|nr:hypothetical protein [Chitinophagaceae bacterium]
MSSRFFFHSTSYGFRELRFLFEIVKRRSGTGIIRISDSLLMVNHSPYAVGI